jgi:hypothetical protein
MGIHGDFSLGFNGKMMEVQAIVNGFEPWI